MSDFENELKALKEQVTASPTTENLTYSEKEQYLRNKRINRKYTQEKKTEVEIERLKNLDLRIVPQDFYSNLEKQADEMRIAQSESLPFITPKLTGLVPFTFPNLITIGANSGQGKTTTCANIAYQLYKNEKRVLILSNEEIVLNVLDRISCLELGYNINKRSEFTADQYKALNDLRPKIGEYVRVVDRTHDGNPELTSSVEGIRGILNSISRQEKFYDCILLDYYQKVNLLKEDPLQAEYAVLQELSSVLDHYYKLVKAPIVVLIQLHPESKEHKEFEKRIKGGKSIMMPSTFVLELRRIEGEDCSEWICHKHRWGKQGESIRTNWERGKFKDIE